MARHRVDYLTAAQEQILRCIRTAITDHGEAPTIAEIGAQVGLRSRSSVHWHLRRIEALGYIEREPRRPRGIRLR
ncbi:helix-turn-helix domain-containing protein [Streptomyces sp. AC495_CC817]|uniref:LexA family protein n=1 Tax=Streptomyces sp. AC495_CC817 TaxID=2823900 RepID=UPI001C25589E|nr:helix-turn-helix domain-containing protein [Streptomyces sp. AC495_CC817]